MNAPSLSRHVFKTSRLAEFSSEKELVNQTGHAVEDWPHVVLKELVDNALDACEETGLAPVVAKVIPKKKQLAAAYRLFARGKRIEQVVEAAIAGLDEEEITVPADLGARIGAYLDQHPAAQWESAVRQAAEEDEP
jgi:hypothetical protein